MSLSPAELVIYGKQYGVLSWFIDGCTALVKSVRDPDTDSTNVTLGSLAAALGWSFSARLAWAAAMLMPYTMHPRSLQWKCGSCSGELKVHYRKPPPNPHPFRWDPASVPAHMGMVPMYPTAGTPLIIECICVKDGCSGADPERVDGVTLERPSAVLDVVRKVFADDIQEIDGFSKREVLYDCVDHSVGYV